MELDVCRAKQSVRATQSVCVRPRVMCVSVLGQRPSRVVRRGGRGRGLCLGGRVMEGDAKGGNNLFSGLQVQANK